MPIGQIDVKGQLKAFPYVKPYVFNQAAVDAVDEADLDDFISSLSGAVSEIPSDISELIGLEGRPGAGIVGTDQWKTYSAADLSFVESITKGLEKSLGAVNKIVNVLEKILRIIELFLNGFNSFSKLIVSAINLAQNKLNEYADDTLGFGVYANVLAPPALMSKSSGDVNSMNQLRGGFEGFLTRLESSVNNPKDFNRPTFTVNDYVGGLVIMLDTEILDDVWQGLSQMAGMFDFMGGFGLNLRPPPPTDMQGFCGFFTDEDHPEKTYAVQIEWDQTYTASGFNLYRSRIPGGTTKVEEYIPKTLLNDRETGEPGLISVARDIFLRIFTGQSIMLPQREIKVYDDPDFDGPVYIPAGLNPSLKYTDFDIKTEPITGTDIRVPIIEEDGKKIPITNYYYLIRACDSSGKFEGPDSKQLVVALKSCNDAFRLSDIIPHPNGTFEFLSVGYGKINSWSSVQLNRMIPWFTEIIGMLNKFLESLKGMATGASDSFSDFLTQIKNKIQLYTDLLGVVSWFMGQLNNFLLGPSIAFLNVTPAKGGVPVFVERVRGAQSPDGENFSGPNGITVAIVLLYGASGTQMIQLKALENTFKFIYNLFTD